MKVINVLLDRPSKPDPGAGAVKSLSRKEILRLQLQGAVTPISEIPDRHMKGRLVIPAAWNRGGYNRFDRTK